MIVIIDTEIWPNLVNQAYRRDIPVVMANGRISTASFPYYRWARPLLTKVLRKYRLLMMQSDEDAGRIAALGAPRQKILVSGNIKFDKNLVEQAATGKDAPDFESGFLGSDGDPPLIVAGSTHPAEEQILLEALRRIRQIPQLAGTRMLLAPRHPERFQEVAELIGQSGFRMRRRTETAAAAGPAEVFLLDTLGELAAAYRLATVAFVGGTLVPRGGHSILEPAFFAKAIVAGPSMENFRAIVEEFLAHNGLRRISAGPEDRGLQIEQLTRAFTELLQNRPLRDELGKNAFSILEKNRGAAEFSAEQIAAIFGEVRKADSSGSHGI
jgi:3-deoxy-D-manno-octulosonic-acid transferase